MKNLEQIKDARSIVLKIAKGIDPLTGECIEKKSFFHDPEIIRCFYFVSEMLQELESPPSRPLKRQKFSITPEQKQKVILTDGKIGINEFVKCIRKTVEPEKTAGFSGVEIYKKLKALGILSEEEYEQGKKRTTTNEKSPDFGFESETRTFNGEKYKVILMNEKGKQFLLNNLEDILEEKLAV